MFKEIKVTHIDPNDCFDIMITDPSRLNHSIQYNDEALICGFMGALGDEKIVMTKGYNIYHYGELMVQQVATALFNKERK